MFRVGGSVDLVVEYRLLGHGEPPRRIASLRLPTQHALQCAVVSACPRDDALTDAIARGVQLTVMREGHVWALHDDRSVEELGGLPNAEPGTREVVVVSPANTWQPAPPGLKEWGLMRACVPCAGPAAGVLVVEEASVAAEGARMLAALQCHGYFKVRASAQTLATVRAVHDATERFTALPAAAKERFHGTTNGRLAPFFGYRSTSLHKELFVYRRTDLYATPPELADALALGFAQMGALSHTILVAMLRTLPHWTPERIDVATADMLARIDTPAQLRFSSFLEVFRYECTAHGPLPAGEPRFRVACAEHRDTSLLTLIPPFRGDAPGLEVFNWGTAAWHVEEAANGDEVMVFAGELFPGFTGTDVSALCHRVVVPLAERPSLRWSAPFELLPWPSNELVEQIGALGKGLASVNF